MKNRDAELAKSLHGTQARLFVNVGAGRWRDTDSGRTGTRAELEDAFLAELAEREQEAKGQTVAAAYWTSEAKTA